MSGAFATKRALRTSVAAAAAGVMAFAPMNAPVALAFQTDPIEIRVGDNDAFTRIEFAGVVGSRARIRQEGRQVIVRLGATAAPDVSRLRVDPPKGVEKVETRAITGATELVLTLAEGIDVGTGSADGAVWLNIHRLKANGANASSKVIPAGGKIPVSVETVHGRTTLRFGWAGPVGAAVFRHGTAVWAVFDHAAPMEIKDGSSEGVRWAAGPNYTAVRIAVAPGQGVSARADGSAWEVVIGGTGGGTGIDITREDTVKASLMGRMAGASRTIWMMDPMSGDRIAVVPALAPGKGVKTGRRTVDVNVLPTAQGMAVLAVADDVTVETAGDRVTISRRAGLKLSSPQSELAQAPVVSDAPRAARYASQILPEWGGTGQGSFIARHAYLREASELEMGRAIEDARTPIAARLAYVRFLVGSGLHYEAIGVLNAMVDVSPALLGVAEVRGLRGAARASIGRYAEAEADLSSGAVAGDASVRLWQGYIAAQRAEWDSARRLFAQGAGAVDGYPPVWRARFATAHAMAALEAGDKEGARDLLAYVFGQNDVPALDQLAARLVQARLFEMDGKTDVALNIYKAVGRTNMDGVATPGRLGVIRLEMASGKLKTQDAARQMESLKWRWRGDATELAVVRSLGELYLSQGLYREALTALKSAGPRITSLPGGSKLHADLDAAFRAMFLEGAADGLQPVQALALFFDFRELTPVGADGDEMVRRLARRLIDVDLLDQAAELLKYQAENRLDGVAKAQVSANLAAVYLMNRQAEPALQALWSSRSSLLPQAVAAERRALEARALMELGRYDHALEVLGRDATPQARQVRAEILWKQESWAEAAALYEQALGNRWQDTTPLTVVEESELIRAGVGYSLSNNNAALGRLSQRYGRFADGARSPGAIRIALAGLDGVGGGSASDFANLSAQADTYAGWIAQTKAAFRERTAPAAQAAAPAAPAATAARPAAQAGS